MMGVFVQLNEGTRKARSNPIGYVIQESGCWQWVGANNGNGYAKMRSGGGSEYAHRVLYEKAKGPIPSGLELDHLCRNPGCVNPDHLEPVTHRTNFRRGSSHVAQVIRTNRCIRGHAFSEDNTLRYEYSSGLFQRFCRECKRLRERQYAAGRSA